MNLNDSTPAILLHKLLDVFHNENKHLNEIEDFLGYSFDVNSEGIFDIHLSSLNESCNDLVKGLYASNNYSIQVYSEDLKDPEIIAYLEQLGLSSDDMIDFTFRLIFSVEDMFKSQSSFKVGARSEGHTYGWRLSFDNHLCGLSCWHVWCANGNNTSLGTQISINNSIQGELFYFEEVSETEYNYWDFAIAKFINPENSENMFDYGITDMVPNKIEFAPKWDKAYTKVGYGVPNKTHGRLIGLFTGKVQLNGKIYKFRDQLKFQKFSTDGDSGAIVYNERSGRRGELLSIIVGANRKYSLGNPLHIYDNWNYNGMKPVKDNNGNVKSFVPSYESSQFLRSNAKSVPTQLGGAARVAGVFDMRTQLSTSSAYSHSISILGKHDDWLYIQITHKRRGGPSGWTITKRNGWTHGSSGIVYLDAPF